MSDARRKLLDQHADTIAKLIESGMTREDAEQSVIKAQTRKDSGTGFTKGGRAFRRG